MAYLARVEPDLDDLVPADVGDALDAEQRPSIEVDRRVLDGARGSCELPEPGEKLPVAISRLVRAVGRGRVSRARRGREVDLLDPGERDTRSTSSRQRSWTSSTSSSRACCFAGAQ